MSGRIPYWRMRSRANTNTVQRAKFSLPTDEIADTPETDSEQLIQSLHERYLASGGVDCLDDAISLAVESAASASSDVLKQRFQTILAGLLDTRNNITAGNKQGVLRINDSQETGNRDVDGGMSEIVSGSNCLQGTTSLVDTAAGSVTTVGRLLQGRLDQAAGNPSQVGPQPDSRPEEGETCQPDTPPGTVEENLATGSDAVPKVMDRAEQLDRAINECEGKLAQGSSDGESSGNRRAVVSNRQALLLMDRYELLGEMADFHKAIDRMKDAASALPCSGVNRASVLYSLANMLLRRYVELKDPGDLDQAIQWAEEIYASIGHDDPNRPEMSRLLSSLLERRFQRLGTMDDLEKAIKIIKDTIASTHATHPLHATMARTLSNGFQSRFQRTGDVKDLDQGMIWAKQAVTVTSANDPAREAICNSLAVVHLLRHNRLGDLDDIKQAINWAEEAIKEPLRNPHIRATSIGTLGHALLLRYHHSWAMEDINRAIGVAKDAISLSPPYDQAGPLNTLGGLFLSRFRRSGDVDDLNQAISMNEASLSMTPADHPTRPTYVENLSQLLFTRYQRFGDPEDLKQGARRITEAIEATPRDDPARARMTCHLGSFFTTRYERSSALGDINRAIELIQEAVMAVPSNDISRTKICRSLGKAFATRYGRLGNSQDLDEGIRWAREEVSGTPSAGNDRARATESLATMLICRYDLQKDVQDVAEARKLVEEAIAETPADFQARAFLDYTLGCIFVRQYEVSRAPEDIEQAIKHMGDAVTAKPLDEPDRALFLYRRAEIVLSRYMVTKSSRDYYFMLRDLYEAWHSHFSSPVTRIHAAHLASRLLIEKKRWQEAYCILDNAVKLLPGVSSRPLMRGDHEYIMSSIHELAPKCVSVALQAGEEPAHCLRLLELGRGVIMGNVIDRRSDLSELKKTDSSSFDKYHRLRTLLDLPIAQKGEDSNQREQAANQREKVVNEFDETLAAIREIPGFEGFQLPPRSEKLMAMATEGPIIIVNSTELRSDAIIVTSTFVQSIALPKLTNSSVNERMSQIPRLVRGGRKTYRTRNEQMEKLLLWLWDTAVEPILEALKMGPDVLPLPRIWWIGVGPLATAPFHAAGDHTLGSRRNTISHAISSYIPTIKALSFAREKILELKPDFRILLVSMPTTPGHNALSNAAEEVSSIVGIVQGRAISTRLDHPSTAEVLAALPSCNAVHFSCHGVSDAKNPSNSHLLLCDGPTLDKLSVETVSNANIKNAQIAYLSACSTAENASDKIPDESIYIASGFQLAGFSHVLATQWVSNDAACRQVASDFYSLLFQNSGNRKKHGGHQRVGAAFHFAVKKLRNQNLGNPILWAPYIHTGA